MTFKAWLILCLFYLSNWLFVHVFAQPGNEISYLEKGNAFLESRHFDSALYWYERILENGDTSSQDTQSLFRRVYNNMGLVFLRKGNTGKAMEFFEKSVSLADQNNLAEDTAFAITLSNLALIYDRRGDYRHAENVILRSLSMLEKIYGPNHTTTGIIYRMLGNIYSNQGKTTEALEVLTKARTIAAKNGNQKDLAEIYHATGNAYLLGGNFDEAEKYFLLAMTTKKAAFGPDQTIDMTRELNNIGSICLDLGKYEEGLKYLEKALSQKEEIYGDNHPLVATTWYNLGNGYRQIKDYSRALEAYQKALSILSPGTSATDYSINPALSDIPYPKMTIGVLAYKAWVMEQQTGSRNDPETLKFVLNTYQLAVRLIDRIRMSYQAEGDVIRLLEESQQEVEGGIRVAKRLYDLTGDTTYINTGLWFMEKSRSALLTSALRELEGRQVAGIPPGKVEQEQNLKAQIHKLEEEAISLDNDGSAMEKLFYQREKYEALIRSFETEYPRYYEWKYDVSVISLGDLQQKHLSPQTVFVSFFQGTDRYYSIIVSRNKADFYEVPFAGEGMEKLDTEIVNFLNFLNDTDVNSARFSEKSYDLYQRLLAPVKSLSEAETLIISPYGLLHYFPFEVLVTENAAKDTPGFRHLPYLFRNLNISYAYSATLRFTPREGAEDMERKFLGIAPDFGVIDAPDSVRKSLQAIPGAIREIEQIERHFIGKKFIRDQATRENFLAYAPDYPILHLGTHAIINDENPLESRMVFANQSGDRNQSFLHVRDLYNMSFRAELVVLSACNTGFGRFQSGEGVLSLGRAFAYAGVPSIVISLWQVQDASTEQLMGYFYKNLSENQSMDLAIRNARLSYLDNASSNVSHPYFWAGFILKGHSAPLQSTPPDYHRLWLLVLISAVVILLLYLKFFRRK